MYRVVNTFKKLNDSDVWITSATTNYFSAEELANEVASFTEIAFNSPGIANLSFKYTSTNESTTTFEVDTLENLNSYDVAISNHPFTALRNRKLREYNIAQYLVSRNISEI
jgi:hypothetical protein